RVVKRLSNDRLIRRLLEAFLSALSAAFVYAASKLVVCLPNRFSCECMNAIGIRSTSSKLLAMLNLLTSSWKAARFNRLCSFHLLPISVPPEGSAEMDFLRIEIGIHCLMGLLQGYFCALAESEGISVFRSHHFLLPDLL